MTSKRKRGCKLAFVPSGHDRPVVGKITYVHPQKRFLTVAYQLKTAVGMSAPMHDTLRIVNGILWDGIDGRPR